MLRAERRRTAKCYAREQDEDRTEEDHTRAGTENGHARVRPHERKEIGRKHASMVARESGH